MPGAATIGKMPATMRFGVRFWPPILPLDPDVEWALRAAFGGVETDASDGVNTEVATPQTKGTAFDNVAAALAGTQGERRLALARRLGLLKRILGRRGSDWSKSAGPRVETLYTRSREASESDTQRCARLERLVDEIAEPLRISYALLDGAAMYRHVPNVAEWRSFLALHILIHQHDQNAFLDGLRNRGYSFRLYPIDDDGVLLGFEDVRAPLADDDGTSRRVELHEEAIHLHTRIPHVRMIPGGDEVTMQHLLDSHRTDRVEGLSDFAHLPGADLILAHVMARGIAQYGYLPRRFSLMSMLADAIDLDFYDNTTRTTQALWWLQPDVNFHEVTALRDVAQCVRAGDIAAMWSDEGRNGRMLRHLVMISLDESYVAGLIPFETIYRVLELKNDGLSLATLKRTKTAFAGIQASLGRRNPAGTGQSTSCKLSDATRGDERNDANQHDADRVRGEFDWRSAARDVFMMWPRATGMHARQWKALVLLILGKRLL